MSDPNINSAKKNDYRSDRDFRSGYSYGNSNMNTVNTTSTNTSMPTNITTSTTKISNQPVSNYSQTSSYRSYNSNSDSSSSYDDSDKNKAIKVRNLIIGGLVIVILAILGVYFFYIRPNNIVFPNYEPLVVEK